MENEESLHCRVCGLRQLEPLRGDDGNCPNYEICDCCGVEFGHGDETFVAAKRYRETWLAGGAVWFRPKEKPLDWQLESQLEQIPQAFKG